MPCTEDPQPPVLESARLSGSWYDPSHSGEGITIEVMTNQELLLRSPVLLERLMVNPALRADQRSRILELLARVAKLAEERYATAGALAADLAAFLAGGLGGVGEDELADAVRDAFHRNELRAPNVNHVQRQIRDAAEQFAFVDQFSPAGAAEAQRGKI